ncbi:unnamed protein product [Soboliphyme baturini]|uniref:Uncharacterized protein n=1 Tax=Soboliphyme baturini TaxID=241478 RepID=A0A183J419_9BILA|nr:unnamed protein product [Soboliphyme baturini]
MFVELLYLIPFEYQAASRCMAIVSLDSDELSGLWLLVAFAFDLPAAMLDEDTSLPWWLVTFLNDLC